MRPSGVLVRVDGGGRRLGRHAWHVDDFRHHDDGLEQYGFGAGRRAHHPDPERQVLITCGPYRFLRHPQYAGNWASLAGLVLALDLRWTWLALLPMTAALLWRIHREERFMTERFGPEWRSGG